MLITCCTVQIIDVLGKIPYTLCTCTIDVQSLIFDNSLRNENVNSLLFETVKIYCQNKTYLIEQKCGKELTRLHMNCTYWVVGCEDST